MHTKAQQARLYSTRHQAIALSRLSARTRVLIIQTYEKSTAVPPKSALDSHDVHKKDDAYQVPGAMCSHGAGYIVGSQVGTHSRFNTEVLV